MPANRPDAIDPTRVLILLLTVLSAGAAAGIRWWPREEPPLEGSIPMVMAIGLSRFALVMGALWVAWPVARKPAMWLPSGVLAVTFIAFGICIVQPRLAIALIPAVGTLITFAAFLKFFRSS